MTDEFRIAFEPISRNQGSDLDRASLAAVSLWINGQAATRLEDTFARTVRDTARVSIHHLATWFAGNWWRLRWEPETTSPSSSWHMSHNLAAAGAGYLWPRLIFSSDGDYMRVRTRPTPDKSKEHIRYLADIDSEIPMAAFEQAVDEFVDGVLARFATLGVDGGNLTAMWEIVRQERSEPAEAELRKLEALLGCDPEEAPEDLLVSLRRSEAEFGAESVGEVAAAKGAEETMPALEAFRGRLTRLDDLVAVPQLDELTRCLHDMPLTDVPWMRAEKLAAFARQTWSLGDGPVKSSRLCELLGSKRALEEGNVPFAAGIRATDRPERFAVICRNHFPVGRRFELARLIADQITAAPADRLLPATSAKTGRQKFQRAFASEFLCPYREIKAELGDKFPNDDDIEGLAAKYDVSSLLVRTSLVNKGDLSRDVLVA